MQLGLIKADEHHDATEEEHPSYKLVKKFAKAIKPDFVVDLGDWFDMSYISSFNEKALRLLEGKRFKADFDYGKRELDFWQKVTKRYFLLEGNHDERVTRLLDKDPRFEGLIEYENAFDLPARGIPYIHQLDQPFRVGKLNCIHGWFTTKQHATKHLEEYVGNLVYGHLHKFQTASKVVQGFKEEVQSWAIGCLCSKEPEYRKGFPTGWQNGFAIMYLDTQTGNFNLYPINIIKQRFLWGGKEWKL